MHISSRKISTHPELYRDTKRNSFSLFYLNTSKSIKILYLKITVKGPQQSKILKGLKMANITLRFFFIKLIKHITRKMYS